MLCATRITHTNNAALDTHACPTRQYLIVRSQAFAGVRRAFGAWPPAPCLTLPKRYQSHIILIPSTLKG